MKTHQDFERYFQRLKQQRDELKLKLHLFKAGTKDEWTKAEKKWKQLKNKMEQFFFETEEATRNPDKTIKNLAKELQEKYQQIRKQL